MAPAQSSSTAASTKMVATSSFSLPLPYRLFFLLIEPISALAGAWFAHMRQADYLSMTTPDSPLSDAQIPLATSVALSQLANMYLLFALIETLVLRSSGDMRVWRAVLTAFLIADFGHLYAVSGLGAPVYWDVMGWNAMDWGNVAFVYMGAGTRIAFLAGVGLGTSARKSE